MALVAITHGTLRLLAAHRGTIALSYTPDAEGWYAHLTVHPADPAAAPIEFHEIDTNPELAVASVTGKLQAAMLSGDLTPRPVRTS